MNEENKRSAFLFQTAKSMTSISQCVAEIPERKFDQVHHESFHNGTKNHYFNCDTQHDNVILHGHEIPFSEEQIKEFTDHSNVMDDVQTFNNFHNEKINDESQNPIETSNDQKLDLFTNNYNLMSKYDFEQPKSPKRTIVFNRRRTLRSNSLSSSFTDSSENLEDPLIPKSDNKQELDEIKPQFSRQIPNAAKTVPNNVETNTPAIGNQGVCKYIEDDIKEQGEVKKIKPIFCKTDKKGKINKTKPLILNGEENSEETESKNTENFQESEDGLVVISTEVTETKNKRKINFSSSRAKRHHRKVMLDEDLHGVFKVPDTEEFLKIKMKTTQSKLTEKEQTAPIKPIFTPHKKIRSQTKFTNRKTEEQFIIENRTLNKQTSDNKIASQLKRKTPVRQSFLPFDPKKELADVDGKATSSILHSVRLLNQNKGFVVLPSATSEYVPQHSLNHDYELKLNKVSVVKKDTEEAEIYRGE